MNQNFEKVIKMKYIESSVKEMEEITCPDHGNLIEALFV
jgi:hypothetical protein